MLFSVEISITPSKSEAQHNSSHHKCCHYVWTTGIICSIRYSITLGESKTDNIYKFEEPEDNGIISDWKKGLHFPYGCSL